MSTAKVLVVEDDPIVAMDIKRKLLGFGYEVCATAATADKAVEAAIAHRPDAILMDITLEGKKDGIQAADEIRKAVAVPIVFLTAHSDQATVQRAKLTLPYGYVLKPVREVELKIALEMAIYTGKRTQQKAATAKPSPNPEITHSAGERGFIIGELSRIEPFSKVREALLVDIAEQCYVQDYRLLEIISLEGNETGQTDGFIVLSGRVAMLKTSSNGRELAVQLLGSHSTFGLLSSLGSQTNELTARAQIESKVLHVPKAALLYLLSEMPELYPEFLAELSRRLNALHDMSRSLAHDKVEVRIAATLAMCLEQTHSGLAKNGEIAMSRQELANLSGTTVETAIRVTKAFEKSGILKLPDHRVIKILEPNKLKVIGEGAEL